MAIGSKELATSELDTFEDDRLVDELKKAKEEKKSKKSAAKAEKAEEPAEAETEEDAK